MNNHFGYGIDIPQTISDELLVFKQRDYIEISNEISSLYGYSLSGVMDYHRNTKGVKHSDKRYLKYIIFLISYNNGVSLRTIGRLRTPPITHSSVIHNINFGLYLIQKSDESFMEIFNEVLSL